MVVKRGKTAEALRKKTAPGDLALVHAFLNTWDTAGPRERFDTPDRIKSWLDQRSLIGATDQVTRAQFEQVLWIRQNLRQMLEVVGNGKTPNRALLSRINQSAESMPLVIQFSPDGTSALLPTRSGVEAALSRILTAVSAAVSDGNWQRMKVCRNPDCQKTFFDKSKNKSAVWCTTAGCGNRLNARAYRARA